MKKYFRHRIEVYFNDFVQVANDDRSDLLEHCKVKLRLSSFRIRLDELVESDRSQVAHRDL